MEKDRWIVFTHNVETGILIPEKMFKSEKDAFDYVFDKEKSLEEAPDEENEIDPTRFRIRFEIHDYIEELSDVADYDGMDVHLMDADDLKGGSLAYVSHTFYAE